jgi:hypothetical protein
MADEPKKIIVDDDWKAQARREKEQLAAQEQAAPRGLPVAGLPELLNMLVMPALGGLGLLATSTGERVPPNLEEAKFFIDLIQMLETKTRGNLDPEEKRLIDEVLYDLRMRFVQLSGAAVGRGPAAPAAE